MSPKLFINRPILACCISVLMVIFGIVGVNMLAVEQFPNIAPPTVTVTANYTGASAETVQKSVIVPLEEAINGVEGMTYMTSKASNSGTADITVYFEQGTDPDMAAVNVQNRVSKVQSSLPAEVTKTGVTTEKRQAGQLKILALYSDSSNYDEYFLANYMKINITPQIQRINGVGGVTVLGSDYALRIWLDPQKMVQFHLVPSDISAVLAEQNLESPTGILGDNSDNVFLYSLKYRGRWETPEEYGNLIIKSLPNGNILRLKDVAKIEIGSESYTYKTTINGKPGAVAMIMQTAGSNANEIIGKINALEEQIVAEMPAGMHLADIYSTKDFLDASIHEVIKTLFEAIVLVIVVVYIFLQSIRSTIIPLISIIVSLVATFACIWVAGFSINMLTLFALVLVIGTVVDDAIVVVEAVQAKFDSGYKSPYKATLDAMSGISSAIVTTSLVFMSVFVPVCFTGGTAGTFYVQFGVTMAVAVGMSCINALTLGPALCALMMKPSNYDLVENQHGFTYRFHVAFDAAFGKMSDKYAGYLTILFKAKWLIFALIAVSAAGLVFLMSNTKTGLVPDEDTGTVFVSVTTSPGYTLNQTNKTMDEITKRLSEIPQIELLTAVSGFNLMSGGTGASGGTYMIRLKNWEERPNDEDSNLAVMNEIFMRTADIKSAQIFAFAPPMISGYGTSSGLELSIQDKQGGSIEKLAAVTTDFLTALNQRPEISYAITTFDPRFPQFEVSVDAARCIKMQVSPYDVLSVISNYIGGSYASDINLYSKKYKVMMQAQTNQRLNEESLDNIFVRNSAGDMLPVLQFLTLKKIYGPELLSRFNLFGSISVNAAVAEGYSSGGAIKAVSEVAKQILPMGYSYEYSGMTREEAAQGNTTIIVYTMCIIFIYIILCSLYESLLIPLAVMLAIPSALAGSFIFAQLMDIENNIYMQTGLIMLMGLISKTAILLTEYASSLRKQGMSIIEASLSAAKARLRPILMTSICMVIGLMPLVVAHGVGANGNRSLGVGVVGGMLIGIFCLILITPVCFVVLQAIQEKFVARFGRKDEETE
ncbi:MAG: efflux RND transporter permease subunit [Succinivibrio sp.]|nr:efflux RND transporter permease subunit [Succinivibrio sp.]